MTPTPTREAPMYRYLRHAMQIFPKYLSSPYSVKILRTTDTGDFYAGADLQIYRHDVLFVSAFLADARGLGTSRTGKANILYLGWVPVMPMAGRQSNYCYFDTYPKFKAYLGKFQQLLDLEAI